MKGQNFENKDILLLRVKEEANLRGITLKLSKSDAAKFVAWSEDVIDFYVHANHSYSKGYMVKHAIVRPMDVDNSWDGKIHGVKIHPILKAEEEAAAAARVAAAIAKSTNSPPTTKQGKGKTGKGKGGLKKNDDTMLPAYASTAYTAAGGVLSTTTLRRVKTPYNAVDLVPLLVQTFTDNPNASNKTMEDVLQPYGNAGVFTDNILQTARRQVRQQLYGTALDNVKHSSSLVSEMKLRGHRIEMYVANHEETLKSMFEVVWDEELMRRSGGASIRKDGMQSFCSQWRAENKDEFYLALGDKEDHLEFVHGFFFAPSVSIAAVPHLQTVFQADAAHVAWGKYTLFSLYGTSANGNMFPVMLGVIFGN